MLLIPSPFRTITHAQHFEIAASKMVNFNNQATSQCRYDVIRQQHISRISQGQTVSLQDQRDLWLLALALPELRGNQIVKRSIEQATLLEKSNNDNNSSGGSSSRMEQGGAARWSRVEQLDVDADLFHLVLQYVGKYVSYWDLSKVTEDHSRFFHE
jgi:hypothetical protein